MLHYDWGADIVVPSEHVANFTWTIPNAVARMLAPVAGRVYSFTIDLVTRLTWDVAEQYSTALRLGGLRLLSNAHTALLEDRRGSDQLTRWVTRFIARYLPGSSDETSARLEFRRDTKRVRRSDPPRWDMVALHLRMVELPSVPNWGPDPGQPYHHSTTLKRRARDKTTSEPKHIDETRLNAETVLVRKPTQLEIKQAMYTAWKDFKEEHKTGVAGARP